MSTTTEKEIQVAAGLGDADASQVLAGATFSSETGFNQKGTLDPVTHDEVVDNLLSTAADLPLSANQGRVLDEFVKNTEYISIKNVQYVKNIDVLKCGNICTIRINGTKEELTSGIDYDLCVLPEKCKPTFNMLKNAILKINGGVATGYFYILSDGTIRIRPKANIGVEADLYLHEIYIIGGTLPENL